MEVPRSVCFGLILLLWHGWTAESSPERRPLTGNILHYEPLSYDTHLVRARHERIKRSLPQETMLLSFQAFNREFRLELKPSSQIFAPGVSFKRGGRPIKSYDPGTFYQGKVIGDPNSWVSGHVIDGVFDGILATSKGEYHIEHAHKFFRDKRDFHSVIYSTKDVAVEKQGGSCAAKEEILSEMRKLQAMAKPVKPSKRGKHTLSEVFDHKRAKRADTIPSGPFCHMRVTADHLYFENIGGSDEDRTISEIVTVFSQVQEIYSTTDFDQNGSEDGITPIVADINILGRNDPDNIFQAPDIAVNDFLDLWSQQDHEDVCLALLLTYRDFDGGVLGLAWVAEPPGQNRGGICEERVRLSVGERSLNTAIVTTLNFGRTQPRPVTIVTIAHELGHNFGSPHDPSTTTTCSPGGSAGNFIMFPRATDGEQANNNRFSTCSRSSILAVLTTKGTCFRERAFCGNGIIEEGEQCDSDVCCRDNCTLRVEASCSVLQPCCTDQCELRNSSVMCRTEDECALEAFCTGTSGACPDSNPRPGINLCNNDMNQCVDGRCIGSVCLINDLDDCECTALDQQCHVCCVFNGECTSSLVIATQDSTAIETGQLREAGRSCNNFQGYCDAQNPPVCVVVDNEQTLNDLLDIFTLSGVNDIVLWLTEYWYVLVLVVVILLVLIFLLHVTYRKRKPIGKGISRARSSLRRRYSSTSSAVTSAQTGGVGEGAEQRRRRNRREISQREAMNRLRHFFPTVDTETLLSVMQASSSESRAVKRLLELGYPLQKVPIPRA